jgi:hypothetical protein
LTDWHSVIDTGPPHPSSSLLVPVLEHLLKRLGNEALTVDSDWHGSDAHGPAGLEGRRVGEALKIEVEERRKGTNQ